MSVGEGTEFDRNPRKIRLLVWRCLMQNRVPWVGALNDVAHDRVVQRVKYPGAFVANTPILTPPFVSVILLWSSPNAKATR